MVLATHCKWAQLPAVVRLAADLFRVGEAVAAGFGYLGTRRIPPGEGAGTAVVGGQHVERTLAKAGKPSHGSGSASACTAIWSRPASCGQTCHPQVLDDWLAAPQTFPWMLWSRLVAGAFS